MPSSNIGEYSILGLHFLRLMHFAAAYIHKYFCSIIACQNKSVFLICVCAEGCPYYFLSISKGNNRTIVIAQCSKAFLFLGWGGVWFFWGFLFLFFLFKNQRMWEKNEANSSLLYEKCCYVNTLTIFIAPV